MSENPASQSFNQNYQILKQTADWLTQQKEPDIDQLVPRVQSAMEAYKACKARLDAVQEALAQYFEPTEDETPDERETSYSRDGKASRIPFAQPTVDGSIDESDDDIPF